MGKAGGTTFLPEDAANPATWGAYSFETTPNRFDAKPLSGKDLFWHGLVSGLSVIIYFGLCYLISI